MPVTGHQGGSGLRVLLSCGCIHSGTRRPSKKHSGQRPLSSDSCERAVPSSSAQLNFPELATDMQQPQQHQPEPLQQQLMQPPPLPREYANLAVGSGFHNYMNMPDARAPQLHEGPAEQSDPQLNYMDMDFSSGVGRPACGGVPEVAGRCHLNYAQLKPSCEDDPSEAKLQQQLPQQPQAEIAYCELDLRAMAALVATAREEDKRLLSSGSLPRLRYQSGSQQQQQHHWQRQSVEGRSRALEKPMSLGRLKSSLSRSLSRLSLIRRRAQSTANQS